MITLKKALLETIKKTEGAKVLTPLDSCFSTRTPQERIKNLLRYSKKHPNIIVGISIDGTTTNFKNGKIINA